MIDNDTGYLLLNALAILIALGLVAALVILMMSGVGTGCLHSPMPWKAIIFVGILLICFVQFVLYVSTYYESQTIEYKNGYADYPNVTLYNKVKFAITSSFTIKYVWYCDGFEDAQNEAIIKSNYTDVQRLINSIKNISNMARQPVELPSINESTIKAQISRV
jgi:hypothetical protein